jgi:hypothetical protein
MKTLTFDFDNIGGIQHVYAIPAEVFQAITVNYATLRRAISMLSTTDVVKIPVFADESFSFQEPHARDEHGDYWQPSISGVIPAASFANADLIETLERGEWVVVHIDQNSVQRVSGDEETPLIFQSTADTGTMYADRNGCSFTFTGKLGHPSYIIDHNME